MASELLLGYTSAFMIGLLGSAHCVGMCGGISASLSMAVPVGPGFRLRQSALILTFNIGRISSYVLIATLLAVVSTTAVDTWATLGPILRTLAGSLLIVMGLSLGQWWQGIHHIERLGAPLWQRLAPVTRRFVPVTGASQALCLGLVWGWLPCGLIYSTLGWAVLQPTVGSAALTMLCFGLGTLPSMLATGFAASAIQSLRTHLGFRRLTGALMVLFGIWTLPVTVQILNGH